MSKVSAIVIRDLAGMGEIHQAEQLQRAIWNMPGDLDIVPSHLLITAQKNGGLLLGAFDDQQMVGLLFGFLGLAKGQFRHCSHIMGMLPAYRGRGIGLRLKHHQRDVVRAQGLKLITWTYDPLEAANATLNIHKLGAISRTYLRNIYGELQDGLNRGLPTDRFEVEWSSETPPAVDQPSQAWRKIDDLPDAGIPLVLRTTLERNALPTPDAWHMTEAPVVAVEFPSDMQRIRATSLDLAYAWRMTTRELFESYFAAGYHVADVLSFDESGRHRSVYLLKHDYRGGIPTMEVEHDPTH